MNSLKIIYLTSVLLLRLLFLKYDFLYLFSMCFLLLFVMYFSYVPVLSVYLALWLLCQHTNNKESNNNNNNSNNKLLFILKLLHFNGFSDSTLSPGG